MTRDELMQEWRKGGEDCAFFKLTPDDKLEIFMSILEGDSDLTVERLEDLCSDYGTSLGEVISNGGKIICSFCKELMEEKENKINFHICDPKKTCAIAGCSEPNYTAPTTRYCYCERHMRERAAQE